MSADSVTDADYQALAAFRRTLRRFLHFSSQAAAEAGLESQQYQALLAIRGRAAGDPMSIGDLAEEMMVRPHSAVGLVTRLEARGLVARERSQTDRRKVFVTLTAAGLTILEALAQAHKAELKQAAPAFEVLLRQIELP